MSRPLPLVTVALAAALSLTGCAATATDAASAPTAHSSHEPGVDHSAMVHDGPSAAAKMICSDGIRDAVAATLTLSEPVTGSDAYVEGVYSCTYPLPAGVLELTVTEFMDADTAQEHADMLRDSYGTPEDIKGLANLGFPAYRTAEGAVVFVKDAAVLVVDARALDVAEGDPTRTAAAYQIATNVLACWKEHHSG
jgi:hypothetical protein